MTQCLIALGGNTGDVGSCISSAVAALNATPGVTLTAVSSLHGTAPMGQDAGGRYLNAAARLTTDLTPWRLLDELQRIECELGRVRTTHWGPRTLDLDLLLYGDEQVEDSRLTVPHPGCWYRRFVLDPVVEIAADVVHPVKRKTFGELRERLLPRPLKIALRGGEDSFRAALASDLSANRRIVLDSCDPAIILWLGFECGEGEPIGVRQSECEFEQLPALPRLDLTQFPANLRTAAQDVLTAALGDD